MTTSGSYDYNLTATQFVTFALRKLGILAKGEAASADQLSDGLIDLNSMLKQWAAKGISLPLYQDVVVFLERGETQYLLGPSGDKASTSAYVKTELSAVAALGASTITVDSITGFSNGNVIGVELDDTTIHWTTINGAPSGSTITLTAVTTAAAAIDNHVYNALTGIISRPRRVMAARLKKEDGSETPVKVITRQEYFSYSNKTSIGKINAVYYDPQLTNGVLYTYLTADSVADTLHLTIQRQIQDMDASSDTLDLPQEWLLPVGYNLASLMADDYGVDAQTLSGIKEKALQFYQEVEDADQEDTIQFVPYEN